MLGLVRVIRVRLARMNEIFFEKVVVVVLELVGEGVVERVVVAELVL